MDQRHSEELAMLDAFDKIFIINLKSEICEQLEHIGLPASSPKVARFDAVRPADAGGFPSIGARGCFMSHLGVLEQASQEGLSKILILEDDLDFGEAFKRTWPSTEQQLRSGQWGIFYGCYELGGPVAAGKEIGPTLIEAPSRLSIGTTPFVAFQGPCIQSARDFLTAMLGRPPGSADGGPMHVDGAYNWLRLKHPDISTWVSREQLGHQRPSRTDIHELRWYDRAPGVSALVQLIRQLKRALRR